MAEENDGNCIGNSNKNDEKDALSNSKAFYQPCIAKMPTERNAPYYNMNHKNRGVAIVFNHEHFDIGGLSRRSGTNVDCECLVIRLKTLGFDVQVFHNLEYSHLYARVSAAADLDHCDNDCFIMVILTHGELGILYAKDSAYKPENLWMPFTADKCPSLAGKPKLFFIQACQGDRLDPGVTLNRTETDGHPWSSYRIPTHADFLLVYSTIPGYYSWRNTAKGSWFIQALCTELDESCELYDLLTLLTFVSRRVAVDYESNVPTDTRMHLQKQIPCITSMLIRLLKLNKKGVNQLENEGQDTKSREKFKNSFSSMFQGRGKTNSYRINY
ncbi:hypothetical protein PPYR_12415 [Photinus pyralis]|uniref:Caspase-1 n=2 Tax=Photinus pyralis TaxID=7054 RepID=A0A5N4AE31_PHOPY|nr:caspase-1-like [Photinus pyralis]KAB0795576.1 hypothetical protein PPYR_12415 [Photinus pyralis]